MKINKTKYPIRNIVKWLWTHHKSCRLQATINVVIGIAMTALSLCSVEVVRRLTDTATGNIPGSIAVLAAIFAAIHIAELIINNLSIWVSSVLGVRTQNLMQRSFFKRIMQGRWDNTGKYHSGDILNRLFSDVNDIVQLMTTVISSTVVVIIQFVASFFYLYSMNATMAVILVVCSPIFIGLSRIYFRKMKRIVRKLKDSNSALQAIIQESVQHKMVIKILEQGDTMADRLDKRQFLLCRQTKARARFSIFTRTCVNLGFFSSYLIGFIWGLYQLQDGIITVGVLMAYTQLIYRIQRPLLDLVRLLPVFVNSLTSCERLIELEELPLEPCLEPIKMDGTTGIKVKDLNFAYNSKPVLSNFSHDFRPGSFTAILGKTGAGKTTLIRLMLSLINPCEGKISLYDECGNETEATPATRINFSYVPQGNTLFSGTIRENLWMGNPNATAKQMKEALAIAEADFVFSLPDGLDTKCSEGGNGLSEGQAQRIAIARSILRPCSILILDEATSALDVTTEKMLLENLKKHFKNTTILFVTHRLAVVSFANDSITLE